MTSLVKYPGRSDVRPRDHLVGWGEDGPLVVKGSEPCPICWAQPGDGHNVTVLGIDETLSVLGLIPRARRGSA